MIDSEFQLLPTLREGFQMLAGRDADDSVLYRSLPGLTSPHEALVTGPICPHWRIFP